MAFVAKLTFAVIANINAGKDNFSDAARCDFACILYDVEDGVGTRNAARQRNGAISTLVIAAILNFEKSPRTIANGVAADEEICLVHFAGMYRAMRFSLLQIVEITQNVK